MLNDEITHYGDPMKQRIKDIWSFEGGYFDIENTPPDDILSTKAESENQQETIPESIEE